MREEWSLPQSRSRKRKSANMINDFLAGMTAWLQGWKMILLRRQLMAVAMIPFMLSFVGAVAAFYFIGIYYPATFASLSASLLALLPAFVSNILYYPLMVLVGLIIAVGVLYLIYVLHALIATPFYALLAERTLQLEGKGAQDFTSWREWSANMVTMLRVSILKALVFVILGAFLFLASFVPVINILAAMAAMFLLAWDCMDYSLEARRLKFRQRLGYFFRNKAQWAGMAFGLALTLLLPGLTLLVIPGAVAGAALILKDTNESQAPSQKIS